MKRTAQLISVIFNPLLIPTYAMAMAMILTPMAHLPIFTRIGATAVITVLTAVLPQMLIYSLHSLKAISNISLTERRERIIPYSATCVLYIIAMVYLSRASAPQWLVDMMLGAAVALVAVTLISLRWKISAHLTGMGGLCAFIAVLSTIPGASPAMMWVLIAAVLVSGCVGVARLGLERHTPAQIGAGYVLGAAAMALCSLF